MRWNLDRVLVVVAALTFLGFGVWLITVPEALEGIGVHLTSPAARIDVRATYGGLELGLAGFLALCAMREDWVRVGLVASACTIAGFGLGRLVGIIVEGQGTPLMWFFFGLEATTTVIYVAVIRRAAPVAS